ncbi:MAG: 6-4 photolyase, partial [Trebouxia sp. A1-2]
GLRLHDNPALLEALKGCKHLYPVFVFDPWFAGNGKVGTNRFSFLLDSLHDLDASFKARGSRLIIVHGNPPDIVPKLIKAWNIGKVCFEADTEPYSKARDKNMVEGIEATGVPWHSFVSHTLYDTAKLLQLNKGQVVTAYSAFQRLAQKSGSPGAPVSDPPSQLPPIPVDAPKALDTVGLTENGVPSLTDIGYHDQPTSPFKGGETLALKRMEEHIADKAWVVQFEKPKGNPAALEPATTVLSPYLKFGCLSVRVFYKRLQEIEAGAKQASQPPVSLRGQLLWREFFYFVGANTPNFDQMEDNPGWMHHLARHAVACFLTRGDLYCPWTAGRDVFDRLLIDDDWSLNNANWMWLSASAFFYQYHRVYSPITFGRKYDPNGDFVRKFVPELKDFPAKWIYEPWKAPIADQKQANCRIGVDYPKPMVDHASVSKDNILKLKDAYADQSPSKGKTLPHASSPSGTSPSHTRKKQASRPVGAQQHEDAQAQASTVQAASGEASGMHTKEPRSGFDDMTLPDDSDHTHVARSDADGAGPSGAPDVRADSNRTGQGANQGLGAVPVMAGPGVFPDGADQDDVEPEATLPGGTARGGSKSGSNGQTAHASDAKQKKLDWTAATGGHKRKAGSESKSPAK